MKTILLGTDWWTDCDDAVAVRVLTKHVKAGKVKLLGIGINACMPDSVASLRGFLEADGVRNVPLGIDVNADDFGGRLTYQMRLAKDFCPEVSNEDAMDAVRLYRKLLAEATEPVEIVEIGFLQVFANLLKSEPDDLSPLCGKALVKEKVVKVWCMAGKWDEDGGMEHNFCRNERSRAAASYFCEHCPVPVTFLGFEIGINVRTGSHLSHDDHLYWVLYDHGSAEQGRHSWDPMTLLLALIGDEARAGYTSVRGYATVDAETGANRFREDPDGPHRYVIKAKENEYYQREIDNIL
jgi:hypothetical protein